MAPLADGKDANQSGAASLNLASGCRDGSLLATGTWGLDPGTDLCATQTATAASMREAPQDLDAMSPSPSRRALRERMFSQMTIGGIRHSMLTLTSTALGGGVLSVSYVMQLSGVGLGSLMLLIGASLSFTSTAALMHMSTLTGKETYASLFAFCVGPRAGPVLDAMLFIYGCGSCVGYMVFLGDFIPSLVNLIAPDAPKWVSSRELAILGSAVLLLPLVLQRDLAALRHVAPISIISLLYMAVVVAAKTPGLHNDHKNDPDYGEIQWEVLSYRLCEAFAICVFAFNCHLNVVPVAGSLVRPTKARITKVSARVNLLQLSFYLLIGITGYLSFLAMTPQDIIKGYDSKDILVGGGRLMLSFTMLVAIPINLLPTVRSALQIGDYLKGDTAPGNSGQQLQVNPRREALRIALTLFALCCQAGLAIVVPGVADVLGLLGATVATAMMLAIPAYAMGVILPQTPLCRLQRALLYTFSLVSAASVPIKVLKWCNVLT